MSGGPGGGGRPACVEKNYAGKFMTPAGADILYQGDEALISWDGGKRKDGTKLSSSFSLRLGVDLGGGSNILDSTDFTFGSIDNDKKISWNRIDPCENSEMRFRWTVPNDARTGKFRLYAYNLTAEPDQSKAGPHAASDAFLIQKRADSPSTSISSSSSSSLSIPAATISGVISSPTPTPEPIPDPTPSPGLSTGAKAGIGVGVTMIVLMVLLALFFFRRRRQQQQKTGGAAAGGERFEKSELDARNTVKPVEAAGEPRVELDAGATQYLAPAEKEAPQEPVELHGQDIQFQQNGLRDTRSPDRPRPLLS